MAIKKRTNRKVSDDAVAPEKLVIVAKPKVPLPDKSKIAELFGNEPDPACLRAFGTLAIDCGEAPDDRLTATDRVTLMRQPYDETNPQEHRYRGRVRNRGTAITAMCITCQGGRKAVTECIDTTCPLWAFRFGSDPFYGKKNR